MSINGTALAAIRRQIITPSSDTAKKPPGLTEPRAPLVLQAARAEALSFLKIAVRNVWRRSRSWGTGSAAVPGPAPELGAEAAALRQPVPAKHLRAYRSIFEGTAPYRRNAPMDGSVHSLARSRGR